ncbi:MAG: Z1 domain-containing protein [Spirochaetales bacterium]|nr:Z1 domain-containing protein [Spirochaetales bacterium]
MEIQIQQGTEEKFLPVFGARATEFFSRFDSKLQPDELENLKTETVSILKDCVNPKLNKIQSTTNLVVGYVQSGKTMSFTALSALASDNGFRVIIYFAGNKNNLLDQTEKRLRKDLINGGKNRDFYKLIKNPDLNDLNKICNELQISSCPTILIVVLKNYKYIKQLAQIFDSQKIKNELKNNGVLIIDDEADQASLNGYAYKNSKSEDWEEDEYTATYKSIMDLRNSLPNHSYVQYTATPQGPLLISIVDLLSPKHHTVLTPGKDYTGGKTFFVDEPGLIIDIPDDEKFNSKRNNLSEPPESLITALQLHILSVAIIVKILRKEDFLSMMVHADREQDASQKFNNWVKDIIDGWITTLSSSENDVAYKALIGQFEKNYDEAIREYKKHNESYPDFSEIKKHIPDIIKETNIELIISKNKRKSEDIPWDDYPSHILIGADMLNRGFTIEKLATTYMPRYSIGKSNADTIQQRCRFFGYKRKYLWSCRVFLPQDVQTEYREYVDHEEEMREWLKENDSLEKVEQLLLITPHLNATRKNILSKDIVTSKLAGWRKINAFQSNSIEPNKKLVEKFIADNEENFILYKNFNSSDRNHRYLKMEINEAISFISEFIVQNMPDAARKQATLRYLKYLMTKQKTSLKFVYVIQMAYAGEPREREFSVETEKINTELFSGHSPKGIEFYPGDREIKFEDSICIQIHNIKFKCENKKWAGKTAYTLAFYYPEDFATNYTGKLNESDL